jgi:hypothetical protein
MSTKRKTEVSILPWYPTPDASGDPTQVHVIIDQDDGRGAVIRFHSSDGVDRFVGDLLDVRRKVWGES